MKPLTELAPDKRAIYDELSEAQQQRYWKIWQSKGPAYTHQMAKLWAEGNQAAKAEAGSLAPCSETPAIPKTKTAKWYVFDFLSHASGQFDSNDAIAALRKAGSTHSPQAIKGVLNTAKVAGLIKVIRRDKTGKGGRVAVYEIVGDAA